MNLTEVIGGFTFTQHFAGIVANGSAIVSFWGSRCIRVDGYEGTLHVDKFAESVMALAHKRNFAFTQAERVTGAEIAKHITRIYNESDDAIAKSNCFTRLCCVVRDFFARYFPCFPLRYVSLVRWHWNGGAGAEGVMPIPIAFSRVFNYYTQLQFLEIFEREPAENEMHFVFGGYNDLPDARLAYKPGS